MNLKNFLKSIIFIGLLSIPGISYAWASVGARGTGNEATSDTSISVTIATANVLVNNVLVAACVTDNVSTGGGNTNDHAYSDSGGNTWTKLYERSNTDAAAAALTLSIAYTKVTAGLTSGSSTVTLTVPTLTAKACSLHEFSLTAANYTISIGGVTSSQADGTSDPTVTLSSLASQEYLLLGASGIENGNCWDAADADYTAIADSHTGACGAGTRVAVRPGYRIATLTTDTYSPSTNTNADSASILGALKEDAPAGASTPGGVIEFF